MQRHATQPVNMCLFVLFMMWAFVQRSAAQDLCDPETQYKTDDNGCCRMCPPGTRMTEPRGTCTEPACTPCGDKEYQDKYTTDNKCKRQPYCDQNKNFEVAVHTSKTSRTTCLCKEGFHCSSEDCITCVPHTKCQPGEGADPIGEHNKDTVCKACADGTFSDETSWSSTCRKWTACETGFYISQSGTATSDNTCVPTRSDIFVTYILPLLVIAALVLIAVLLYKVKPEPFKSMAQWCKKSHQPIDVEPETVTVECRGIAPEENEDDESLPTMVAGLTDNGNVVEQEFGKQEQLSRQESQTETCLSI